MTNREAAKRGKVHSFDHVTPELLAQVDEVIEMAASHKLSTSKIYATHNAVYQLKEQPNSCPSCLQRRADNLRRDRPKMVGETEESDQVDDVAMEHAYANILNTLPELPADKSAELETIFQLLGKEDDELTNDDIAVLRWKRDQLLNEGVTRGSSPAPDPLTALLTRLGLARPEDKQEELTMLYHQIPVDTLEREDLERVNNRIVELRDELGLNKATEGDHTTVEPQYLDPSAPGFVEPAIGVIRHPMGADELPLDFTPNEDSEDKTKGKVLWADGSKVGAGTYETANGLAIAVQPGGKATIKDLDI